MCGRKPGVCFLFMDQSLDNIVGQAVSQDNWIATGNPIPGLRPVIDTKPGAKIVNFSKKMN
jgi:hypothetical protein